MAILLAAFATLAVAQTPQPASPLAADTSIISVRYDCGHDSSAAPDACQVTVTKKDFDALVQALDPAMTPANRQSLATEYSRLLIMAAEARRRGIDRQPELQSLIQFSTLQLLATRLVRAISTTPAAVSAEEVEKYFREHLADYQEVRLSKIVVPAQGQSVRPAQGSVPAAERALAIQKRAQSGEDFVALQNEINAAHATSSASGMAKTWLRCGSLPEAHRAVCSLEPGQVSNPIADGQGYSIYRLDSRRESKLDDVRDEIRASLERDRLDKEIHRVRTPLSLQLDERYFGKLPKPDLAEKHGLHYPPVTKVAPPQAQHRH